MITLFITLCILHLVGSTDRNTSKVNASVHCLMKSVREEARYRYIESYAMTDNDPAELSRLFDYLIEITQLKGNIQITNRRAFKSMLSDSIIAARYPNPSYKAEAMYIFDFVLEAYDLLSQDIAKHNLCYDFQHFASVDDVNNG